MVDAVIIKVNKRTRKDLLKRLGRGKTRQWAQKTISLVLVCLLIFEIMVGALVPFNFSLNPPSISLQEAKAAGEGWLSGWSYRYDISKLDNYDIIILERHLPR